MKCDDVKLIVFVWMIKVMQEKLDKWNDFVLENQKFCFIHFFILVLFVYDFQ